MRDIRALTLIEILISIVLMTLLIGSAIFVYIAGVKTWNAGYDRSTARGDLSRALQSISRDLRKATAVGACDSDELEFTVDSTVYYIYTHTVGSATTLRRSFSSSGDATGGIFVDSIYTDTTVLCNDDESPLLILDIEANKNGSRVRMRTRVRPRNL